MIQKTLPGYRRDHSFILLHVNTSMSIIHKDNSYWKFNYSLLQNNDYINLVNKIFDNSIIQYIAIPYNSDAVTIPIYNLHFIIDADLFWETLLIVARGETISFGSRWKKENEKRENLLLREISLLEVNVNESNCDLPYEKNIK